MHSPVVLVGDPNFLLHQPAGKLSGVPTSRDSPPFEAEIDKINIRKANKRLNGIFKITLIL
jgi:hypothetical protein